MTSRDPKGAVGSTVGYPSDSLAPCCYAPACKAMQSAMVLLSRDGVYKMFVQHAPSGTVSKRLNVSSKFFHSLLFL